MSANKGPFQARLRQLAAKFDSSLHNAPLSDSELLELYRSVNIHDKIAKEAAMPEPNLRHLVVLCNMNVAITLGQYQICTHAPNITTYSALPQQASSDYEKECLKVSDTLSIASRQCDKSLRFRIDNIPINFETRDNLRTKTKTNDTKRWVGMIRWMRADQMIGLVSERIETLRIRSHHLDVQIGASVSRDHATR